MQSRSSQRPRLNRTELNRIEFELNGKERNGTGLREANRMYALEQFHGDRGEHPAVRSIQVRVQLGVLFGRVRTYDCRLSR